MPRRIASRCLGVTFLKSLQGEAEEGIEYRLAAQSDLGVVPPPEYRLVRSQSLERLRLQVQTCITSLLAAARSGQPRGEIDLEDALRQLGDWVLPDTGLGGLFQQDQRSHPWLDVCPSAIADLPWEAFPERYRFCLHSDCSLRGQVREAGEATVDKPGFCSCGQPLRLVQRKLGFGRHVTHLVRSSRTIIPAEGREFLIIANPTGDLFSADSPAGAFCRQHIAELVELLESAGYRVELLRESAATSETVLQYLRRPEIVGMYYFGHGYLEEAGDEGGLILHGRAPLFAREIERLQPRCPFVFLNACHGAATGRSWGLNKRLRGMAHAFAAGGRQKVVLAPLWPVSARLGAAMALDFFRRAVKGVRLCHALRGARKRSYRRYEQGEPDFGWAAYRYFGDPDRTLPVPVEPVAPAGDCGSMASRLVDQSGTLNLDLFAFPIDEVLLRAAKRRNLQGRTRVSATDLIAGAIRRGELTRYALRQLKLDPDALYEHLERATETPLSPDNSQADRPSLDTRDAWIIRHRDDFRKEALQTLQAADSRAQRDGQRPIHERDLLLAMLDICWDSANGSPASASVPASRRSTATGELPPAEQMRSIVEDESRSNYLDDNGCILLDALGPDAQRVVDRAHGLAQLRGICPINTRLMLAAFMLDEDGYAAQLCQQNEVHTGSLARVLLNLSGGQGPQHFRLGDEACSRIITPMIQEARRRASPGAKVDETVWFRAFCASADPQFKQLLRSLPRPWCVDLDALFDASSSPRLPAPPRSDVTLELPPPPSDEAASNQRRSDQEASRQEASRQEASTGPLSRRDLEDEAWQRLLLAAHWARLQHWSEVRSTHLFVALLGDGTGLLGTILASADVDPEICKTVILRLSSTPPDDNRSPHHPSETGRAIVLSPSVAQLVRHAVRLAQQGGRRRAAVRDLEASILSMDSGIVAQQLQALRVDLDPWWLRGNHNGNGAGPPRPRRRL